MLGINVELKIVCSRLSNSEPWKKKEVSYAARVTRMDTTVTSEKEYPMEQKPSTQHLVNFCMFSFERGINVVPSALR